MKQLQFIILTALVFIFNHCNYLDVVPDNVATIDNAFTMRNTAEKYLFTCYRYLPNHASYTTNPAFLGGDEIWTYRGTTDESTSSAFQIAQGFQNVNSPFLNVWDSNDGPFNGIHDCNIFLENIGKVPDMSVAEKERWAAEAKVLKAFYHFWLLKMYGPIPVIKQNLDISSTPEKVQVEREPIDVCIDYIVELIDEAAPFLPDFITDELTELGRIDKPVALSIKSLALITAASPLFNGNQDYADFTNKNGTPLFDPVFKKSKWERAMVACEEAIDLCHEVGKELNYFQPSPGFQISSYETLTQMSIRNAVTERWNPEIIWGNTNSRALALQRVATPAGLDPSMMGNFQVRGTLAPPIKIAEMFYSKNGVPISEDKEYNYSGRFDLRVAVDEERYHLQPGYTTVELHFDREQRFYTSLAFDGGLWYGQGKTNDNDQWVLQAKAGQYQSMAALTRYSVTGYWPKKLVNYENIIGPSSYEVQQYPWPVIRLADLYLLYAEALNEADAPLEEVYPWINLIRERAGLNTVEESWSQYSSNPEKYKNKDGLREIIQQERLIELVFEGKRFWDLRRWKRAHIELNNPITGWDISQETDQGYYRQRVLHQQTFMLREYLWPIRESNLTVNKNLVQNPGW